MMASLVSIPPSVSNTTAIGQWSDRRAWPPGSTVVKSTCSKLAGLPAPSLDDVVDVFRDYLT
jgi:hypothetical protein